MVFSEGSAQRLHISTRYERFKAEVINFLFPIRFRHSVSAKLRLLILIGIMIAMRLIIGLFSIRIYATFSVSISWIPISILGWYIGPVYSIFIGFFTNTLSWLMSGSVWFWMYAIQTPLVMVINSIFGYIYEKRKGKKKLWGDYFFLQCIILFFTVSTIYISMYTTYSVSGVVADSLKIGVICALVIFLIVIEVFLNYSFFVRKRNLDDLILFIYVAAVSTVNSYVFSFILGTISSIEYFRYISYGNFPESFEKYGFLFYLFPRVIKETFRLPLVIIVTYVVQRSICIPEFARLKQNAKVYW